MKGYVMVEFEEWAGSKGFNLERNPDNLSYQDPITNAVYKGYKEGYQEGYFEAVRFFKPQLIHMSSIMRKNGLEGEFKELQKSR